MSNRREFITLLGGAAAAWPLAARAERAGKLPTIGFLGAATASAWRPWTAVFVQRLDELGWIERRTVAIEYRWAEGRPERYAEIAAEFVRRKVDVIVTVESAVPAVKQATSVTPIVFAVANDPVGGGLVASLSRPGGNVTGLSAQQADIAGKRLDLLREIRPDLRRLAVLANVGHRESVLETDQVQAAARSLSIEVAKLEIRRAEDIAPAFEALKGQADALYVVLSALVATNRRRLSSITRAPCRKVIRALGQRADRIGATFSPAFCGPFICGHGGCLLHAFVPAAKALSGAYEEGIAGMLTIIKASLLGSALMLLESCTGYLTNYQTPCVEGHVCECVRYTTINRSWLDCRDYGRVKSRAY